MRKQFIALFILISTFCFSQIERSEKFVLNAGLEYRITPFDYKHEDMTGEMNQNIIYNRDNQLSGFSLNIGLDWYILKNTSFGILSTFRYNNLYYNPDVKNYVTISNPVQRLIYDFQIELKHRFILKGENKIILIGGFGFMNNNTRYYINTPFQINENGEVISYYGIENNFNFNALKFGCGYVHKNFEISIGSYFVDVHNFTNYGHSGFGIPYLKLNYNFAKF